MPSRDADLSFVTKHIDGQTYGVWYRLDASNVLEIFGIGFYVSLPLQGENPHDLARAALQEFILTRREQGVQLPSLTETATASPAASADKSHEGTPLPS